MRSQDRWLKVEGKEKRRGAWAMSVQRTLEIGVFWECSLGVNYHLRHNLRFIASRRGGISNFNNSQNSKTRRPPSTVVPVTIEQTPTMLSAIEVLESRQAPSPHLPINVHGIKGPGVGARRRPLVQHFRLTGALESLIKIKDLKEHSCLARPSSTCWQ
jgi:hypothetical protein